MRNRGKPVVGNPRRFKTHAIRAPLATHFRIASCAEIECTAYREGWNYHKQTMSDIQLYTVTHSGRRWREMNIAPGFTYIIFEPGQRCFETHRVSVGRPEFFFIGRGDSRVFQTNKATQYKPNDFVDEWANHLDKIAKRIMRG